MYFSNFLKKYNFISTWNLGLILAGSLSPCVGEIVKSPMVAPLVNTNGLNTEHLENKINEKCSITCRDLLGGIVTHRFQFSASNLNLNFIYLTSITHGISAVVLSFRQADTTLRVPTKKVHFKIIPISKFINAPCYHLRIRTFLWICKYK